MLAALVSLYLLYHFLLVAEAGAFFVCTSAQSP